MSHHSLQWKRWIVVAAVITGTGCEFLGLSENPQPPAETTTQEEVAPTPPPAPKPVAKKQEEDYQRPEYPNNTRRNPFQPDLEVIKPPEVGDPGQEERLDPLERFALSELELVAIISEVAVPKAMFIDPEGFGHVLKEGDRIGQNSGVLSDIRDNEVEVTETTGEDGGQTRLRMMKLRTAELTAGNDSALSDEERAALEKLLETEEGRKALEARYRDMALGASASDGQQNQNTRSPQSGGLTPPKR